MSWRGTRERILLIIEVKATLTDLQDLLSALSRKLRVVPELARKQLGWDADHVARIIVVAGTAANRSIVARTRRDLHARRFLRLARGPILATPAAGSARGGVVCLYQSPGEWYVGCAGPHPALTSCSCMSVLC